MSQLPEDVRRKRHELFVREYDELLIALATQGTHQRALKELGERYEITRERVRQILLEKWDEQ